MTDQADARAILTMLAPRLPALADRKGLKPPIAAVLAADGVARVYGLTTHGLGAPIGDAHRGRFAGPMVVLLVDHSMHALSVRITSDLEIIGGPPVYAA
jgi:hypothetical protein